MVHRRGKKRTVRYRQPVYAKQGDQSLLHKRLAHRLRAQAGVRDLATHRLEDRRRDAAGGEVVDDRSAQQIEEAERRIMRRRDRGAQ